MASWDRGEEFRQNGDGEEEEEEEEIATTGYKLDKDAVLFAIHVSDSMLQKPPPSNSKKAVDDDSPTLAALKAAYQLMQQRIISKPNDMMGILLFGTEESRTIADADGDDRSLAYPHCYLLIDLDVPAAEDVKKLRSIVEGDDDKSKVLQASKDSVSMANVLFCANQIFTTRAANFGSRRLFIVTDDDDPHGNNKSLREAAAVRAKDLYDLGVIIELFPIAAPGSGFDRTKFYDDIVYRGELADPEAPAPIVSAAKTSMSGDGITLLQSLLSSVNSKAAMRRAIFSLPLELGPGFKIGVKGYVMIHRQNIQKSCYVWTGGERAQIATGSTTIIAEDSARTVEKQEIRKAYKFGDAQVTFTEEEEKGIRYFGDPVIRVIGFKPLHMLPIWANHRPAYFIYPDETDYVGSTRVFSALQQKLLVSNKFALVWFISRRNASPRLAAMYAGEERLADDGIQVMPPGLWIQSLPFADDIRTNPDAVFVKAPQELIEKMKKIVTQLQLPKNVYDPSKYPNPHLQWFYRILQAMALEEDIPIEPEDKTIPRYRQIKKRAGELVADWQEQLKESYAKYLDEHPSLPIDSHKRKGEANGGGAAKKIKTEAAEMTDEDFRRHYDKDMLSKLTVGQLKEFVSRKGLERATKKADLVAVVETYFEHK